MTDLATLHRAIGDLVREIEGGKIGFKAISERLRAMLPREETLAEVAEELVAWWDNESKPLPLSLADRLRAALAREWERGRG